MIQFILGALAGAAAAWYWRRDIEDQLNKSMPDWRSRAADRLQSMERTAEDVLDKAKTGVVTRIRAGEERLRKSRERTEAGQPPRAGEGSGRGPEERSGPQI